MGIRFLLDGAIVALAEVDPTATLLDHLRYRMARTGTKEGCSEGDCGACTVLIGELAGDAIAWRAVNACILFLPMLDGKVVLTVESLDAGRGLNSLQACMAANGSSQCGFCTPGFVMSLYGRAIGARGHDLPVADVIAGNLCRCTGYGPLLAAGQAIESLVLDGGAIVPVLRQLATTETLSGSFGARRWFIPKTTAALADLLDEYPEGRIVAGATDVGIWVTKRLQTIETLVFVGDIGALRDIVATPEGLMIGAGVRWADAHPLLAQMHPDLGELVRRFAGLQVRNAATIGGNIANGSPIGDGPPALIALSAQLTLRSKAGCRTLPLEDYFRGYGAQDRQAGEFVESVFVPRPAPDAIVHIAKLSRRFDSDISAVCGAFHLTVRGGEIAAARVAFGGMAATPLRALGCEAALVGQPFAQATMVAAATALRADFTPLNDVRGSAAYRSEAAANLLLRLWYKAQGHAVSVLALECADG
jgi:xanthine dehydrogenase small subunit